MSKRGKEESRGKDAGMLKTSAKRNGHRGERNGRLKGKKDSGKEGEKTRIKDHGFV